MSMEGLEFTLHLIVLIHFGFVFAIFLSHFDYPIPDSHWLTDIWFPLVIVLKDFCTYTNTLTQTHYFFAAINFNVLVLHIAFLATKQKNWFLTRALDSQHTQITLMNTKVENLNCCIKSPHKNTNTHASIQREYYSMLPNWWWWEPSSINCFFPRMITTNTTFSRYFIFPFTFFTSFTVYFVHQFDYQSHIFPPIPLPLLLLTPHFTSSFVL